MPVWKIAPIKNQPSLALRDWRVYEVCGVYEATTCSRHFVGTDDCGASGRVSSRIELFDAVSRRGTTMSGRVYELVGPPGLGLNAEYAWNSFCAINRARDIRDVTKELLQGGTLSRQDIDRKP